MLLEFEQLRNMNHDALLKVDAVKEKWYCNALITFS